MYNRWNTMQRKHLPNTTSGGKKFKQIPKLTRDEVYQPSRFVTNNKLTKKIARLLVALAIILIIIFLVILAT